MADDNNLTEAPKVDGQADETVKEVATEEVAKDVEVEAGEESTTETETVSEESKGIPDDPKLLRAKMTQATQETAELKGKLEKLSQHPKIKAILDEIETGKAPSEEPTRQTYADLTDEQKAVYGNMKPFLEVYSDETGISQTPKTIQEMRDAEQVKAINTMVADFDVKHPEAKAPEVRNALAKIINETKVSLDNAWKIYKSDTAESTAKQKVQKELEAKKDISLLKPTGTNADKTVKGKMSRKQAMREAIKTHSK